MSEQDEPLAYNPLAWLTGEAEVSSEPAETPVEVSAPPPAGVAGEAADADLDAPTVAGLPEHDASTPPSAATVGDWVLAPELTLATLSDTAQQLADCLAAASGGLLDGSAVERIDFSGLQLLAACFISASQEQRPLRLTAASPALARAIETAGLGAVIEC